MATVVGLEGLEGLILETIVSKLGPKNAVVLAGVSTRLRSAASDDAVWRRFCSEDFDLAESVDPDGNRLSSFKETYKIWFESFKMYPLPLVKRAKNLWTKLRNWLAANFPEVINTLNKGLSENQIKSFENSLGLNLPMPTRVLYRFCNGQSTINYHPTRKESNNYGIIGGYEFYIQTVNVHLLPLNQIFELSQQFTSELGFLGRSKFIVIAISWNFMKVFFLDCENGQIYVCTRSFSREEMMPCVPTSLVRLNFDDDDDNNNINGGINMPQDGLMLWLEEHVRRLQNGIIRTRVSKESKSICLFPEASPLCSSAVTNGVKVRASAVFVPEGSDLGGELDGYLYAYSIRISLVPEGFMLDGTYFSCCQLHSRHWIIRSRDTVTSDVRGEAVIGKYPLLTPGMDEFVYESCTPVPAVPGSVEGSFTFVPGRLSKPEGRQFEVRVAPFILEEPEYIF